MERPQSARGREGHKPVEEYASGRRGQLIGTDFGEPQDDLSGGNACRQNCAKMSQESSGLGRSLSPGVLCSGNICHCKVSFRRHHPCRAISQIVTQRQHSDIASRCVAVDCSGTAGWNGAAFRCELELGAPFALSELVRWPSIPLPHEIPSGRTR